MPRTAGQLRADRVGAAHRCLGSIAQLYRFWRFVTGCCGLRGVDKFVIPSRRYRPSVFRRGAARSFRRIKPFAENGESQMSFGGAQQNVIIIKVAVVAARHQQSRRDALRLNVNVLVGVELARHG